jgi:iron complex outermembrane receptor protein
MPKAIQLKAALTLAMCIILCANGACAANIDIPAGELSTALDAYSAETGIHLLYADDTVRGLRSSGVKGNISADVALTRLLSGTGLVIHHHGTGEVTIVRDEHANNASFSIDVAANPTPANAALETVTVTSSKIGGDVQNIPISITALSQEQLTATQTAGGPDLIKQVPNMTFTKTNFSGYSIQLRGIGTQAISVTTDPAVAVALNDIPFIRNHFFEQEFYDLSQAEVLRGPQGTLYGRNATAGVVNLVTAKPTDQFEAMASLEIGNYGERRPEGMINIPIVDDRLDIRVAGEWTKRQGYSFNRLDDQRVDGRDLWSGRVSVGWKPFEDVQTNLVWEHFSEDDDRMRTSKQLCKTAPNPTEVDGVPVLPTDSTNRVQDPNGYLNQGCIPTSLYSPSAFEVPNGDSLAYYQGFAQIGAPVQGGDYASFDPYASTTQSQNLRVIETHLNPVYRAKNDTVELNTDYKVTPSLTFTAQTGFNNDFLWSTEDYNRFDTAPGAFAYCDPSDKFNCSANSNGQLIPDPSGQGRCQAVAGQCAAFEAPCVAGPTDPACQLNGVFCDPQLGCSDRLVAEDLSDEHAWQLSQEFRLASNFDGPFNFSVGGNYLHYETEENYYVFINTFTLAAVSKDNSGGAGVDPTRPYVPGVTDNVYCLTGGLSIHNPFAPDDPQRGYCKYIDPNPLTKLNNEGHNYFLSQNPYVLNSYAAFGETYYNILSDLKLTTGLRWTEDQKHFTDIPSELFVAGYGYATTGVVNQQWDELTGRAAANWTPKLDFTDQTLIYASYAHGYKAGGANPPGAVLLVNRGGDISNPLHPLTFKPEFIDAFEIGTKNTLLDGSLTFNADAFYYNYENYQISEIVDRTSINLNFDAHVKGAEVESTWEPLPGLRFNFAGGWEDTALAKGTSAVDLMDRADLTDHPDWMVVKPFVTQASNCILPTYVVAEMLRLDSTFIATACGLAYTQNSTDFDPVTNLPYVANPSQWCDDISRALDGSSGCGGNNQPLSGYAGFNPETAPNDGQGFAKNLSGKELPNAPPFTVSFGAQYTMPLSTDWAGTARGDFYWQDSSWARVFNDNPYDRLHGYTNLNLTLIFTNQNGWQVMLYDKNVFNTTAITGDFLNSDDSALTTNVFLTDPKLIGIRVTKNW